MMLTGLLQAYWPQEDPRIDRINDVLNRIHHLLGTELVDAQLETAGALTVIQYKTTTPAEEQIHG
jgi:hypothetical protein